MPLQMQIPEIFSYVGMKETRTTGAQALIKRNRAIPIGSLHCSAQALTSELGLAIIGLLKLYNMCQDPLIVLIIFSIVTWNQC